MHIFLMKKEKHFTTRLYEYVLKSRFYYTKLLCFSRANIFFKSVIAHISLFIDPCLCGVDIFESGIRWISTRNAKEANTHIIAFKQIPERCK